jgi:hypothetical protein
MNQENAALLAHAAPGKPAVTTLEQLESHLWEAASILRGSPVDRNDWAGGPFWPRACRRRRRRGACRARR